MSATAVHTVSLSFPGDLAYVSAVRKLVSEVLVVNSFPQKFAYRTEVIVDEICTNAVRYGCHGVGDMVHFECNIEGDRMELLVKDPGGTKGDLARLQSAVALAPAVVSGTEKFDQAATKPGGLGLEIVRMLSESVEVSITQDNQTTIKVIRLREER